MPLRRRVCVQLRTATKHEATVSVMAGIAAAPWAVVGTVGRHGQRLTRWRLLRLFGRWCGPAEKQEGTNKLGIRTTYFTYLVRTESALPGMRADGAEVRRRFSEFDVSGVEGRWGGAEGPFGGWAVGLRYA